MVGNLSVKTGVAEMNRVIFLILLCAAGLSAQTIHSNIPYRVSDDPYAAERCRLDIWLPDGLTNFATVVWFHGGGLKNGSKSFPQGLLNQGVAVVSVNYRLYPKVTSPVYVQDAAASVAWVLKNIQRHGGNSDFVFLSGHSAGGYLASMVGLDKSYLAEFGANADDLAGLIPLSGHTITHFTVREERGIPGKQPVIDEMAPLFHVRADAPPLLLITGDRELEMLGRYEENAYMMRMMRVAGHSDTRILELDGYGHGIVEPACPLIINEVQRILKQKRK
jgi:acetyl esterase/lipase